MPKHRPSTDSKLTARWKINIHALLVFKKREGHCNVPCRHKEWSLKLGSWLKSQRIAFNKGKLSRSRATQLQSIGLTWRSSDESWGENLVAIHSYKERLGHLNIPHAYREEGVNLGAWLHRQKIRFKDGKLSSTRIEMLREAGVALIPSRKSEIRTTCEHDEIWNLYFPALLAFKGREGHVNVRVGHKENGLSLGIWLVEKRFALKKGRLPADMTKNLMDIGIASTPNEESWNANFDALKAFYDREGHSNVKRSHKESDLNLGTWLNNQRISYIDGDLSPDRIRRLESIGVVWDAWEWKWIKAIAALKNFKAREGHCNAVHRHVEGDVNLGAWIARQHSAFRVGSLSVERIKELESIGVDFRDAPTPSAVGQRQRSRPQMNHQQSSFPLPA